ncbi:PD-(D/E)XK nuclease family protein [Streptomyces sp. ISL-11]|uniref:RecB family exonuclease n=1 Tax=Streptomyces sp. ISL-11 TaxID=2819174 RepID=UPI001BE902DA|nr:PD-(D/E)XK nuclease family protein [Streptomyces sp. ISL-11]MBT2383887.1 PD-(D/E)XK nuclease family protein [Streptomyces sp. ISL-11]
MIETQPRSVSQTQQYEECPWRFYLQRVRRETPRPAAWSHHGVAFHAFVEAYELSERTMSIAEGLELFSDRYSSLVNADLEREPDTDRWLAAGLPGGADIERRYVVGREQVRHYVGWAAENPTETWVAPDGRAGLELCFMTELGGVQVRGYIDQLVRDADGSVRPRDWKTGSTKSRFQLETYAVAVRKEFGEEVNRADWYLAKTGRLSRPVKLDDGTEERVAERFAAMDAGVKAGNFPAKPGFNCRFCDVSHACSFGRKVVQ